jgi:hypothetical protein
VRVREWRLAIAIVASCLVCAAVLAPVMFGFRRIHQQYGFARTLPEVLFFSADLASLVSASPLLSLWRWTSAISPGAELQLFPGLTITMLAAVGLTTAIRRHPVTRDGWRWVSLALMLVACVFAIVAVSVAYLGPWGVTLVGVRMTATVWYKPVSVALVALAGSLAARPWARAAWHERSALAFYLMVAGFLFLCSLGPKPALLGRQFLYRPPYDWFMNLPGFAGGIRAPARFAMPAILALSVAAAIGFHRLKLSQPWRRALAVAVVAGIVADGWIGHLEVPAVPASWPMPADARFGPVLELPPAQDYHDFIAMYRTTLHGHPTVNGHSAFFPPHYAALQFVLKDGDATAFDAVTRADPLLVVLDRRADPDGRWSAIVRKAAHATIVSVDERWTLFSIPPTPRDAPCVGSELAIASAMGAQGPIDASVLSDHDPNTWFVTKGTQRAGETLTIDLGRTVRLCAVRMSLDTSWWAYPRLLAAATSGDGQDWSQAFSGSTAGLMIRGTIERPREVWIDVPVRAEAARYIRLRLEKSDDAVPWFIPEMRVIGWPR